MSKAQGKKIDGKALAVEMMQHLAPHEQERLLAAIEKLDPKVSNYLGENLIDFQHLTLMTPKMLVDFLKYIPLGTLGLALRGRPAEEAKFFLQSVSSFMRAEIEHTLKGPPVSLTKVQQAQSDILQKAQELAKKGIIILKEEKQ